MRWSTPRGAAWKTRIAFCSSSTRAQPLERRRRGVVQPVARVDDERNAIDAAGRFERIFMVSALTGDGIADLKTWIAQRMPEGPWLFPEDQLMEFSERLLAAELTREQIFRQLHQELPYAVAVTTDRWTERKDGSVRIDQTVHVERDGQKAIVIGAGGARLKALGAAARGELAKALERPVHLFLHVKVAPDWGEQPGFYRDWGLDFAAGAPPRRG